MGFQIGDTVGPYKITRYIGQGGMATIYRAHQMTLDRDVAIKAIHPALKDDPAFLARLSREADIVGKLNHPNIVAVYDSGECDGQPYLVMRLIEGKTLKQLLQDRQLTSAEVLHIARAVADALIYAHAHGVLHRDVKTSNILMDNDSNAFLTDFGLARLAYSGDSTLSRDMLIGSPQYISPEQAKGEPIDVRSDIYSFGIVLFEMFTGQVPFSGETPYATIMAHINEPLPSARALNPNTPLAVEMVLYKALAKNREQRYASVSEMITALENAIHGPQSKDEPASDDSVPIILNPFPVAAAPPPDSRGALYLPLKFQLPAISRRQGVILAIGGLLSLCVLIPCLMFWGILRFQGPFGALFLPSVTPYTLRLATPLTTPTRSVLPSPLNPNPIVLPVATTTRAATASPVTAPDLPRGRIAYSIATGEAPDQHSIWIANANGTGARQLFDTAIWPAFSPDGKQIAYYRMRDSGIYVAGSDGSDPRRVIPYSDTCCVQWSPDGKRLVYFRGNLRLGGLIFTAEADGSNMTELFQGFNPAWSPDGSRLAYTACQPNTSSCGLFVFDLKSKASTMLTRDNGSNPQWSPRGDRLVYQADDGKGHTNVFVTNADGSNLKQLTTGKGNDGQPTWSRDGNFIIWRSDQNGIGWAIFSMRADGAIPRLLVRDTPATSVWGRESLTTAP